MANSPLDLIEVLLASAAASEEQFVSEHPHPMLMPEKVRSGLLQSRRGEAGTGTLAVGPRQPGQSEELSSGQILVLRKEVHQGRLDRFDQGAEFGTWIHIGRQSSSDVMINDFSVSKEHAQVRRHGSDYEIQDLGSSNGSELNGQALVPLEPTVVQSGDLLRLGRIELVFLLGPELYRLLQPSVSDFGDSIGRALSSD